MDDAALSGSRIVARNDMDISPSLSRGSSVLPMTGRSWLSLPIFRLVDVFCRCADTVLRPGNAVKGLAQLFLATGRSSNEGTDMPDAAVIINPHR